MQVDIDLVRAERRHPEAVDQIVAEMNRKLAKAKLKACAKEDLTWRYVWAQRLGGDPLDNCFVSLHGKLGRRSVIVNLAPAGSPTPWQNLPEEVVKAYQKRPVVTRETFPDAAELILVSPDDKGKTAYALSGYRSKNGVYLHIIDEGDEISDNGTVFEPLYKIEGRKAIYSGSLHRKAKKAFDATEPGGEFRYRNMKFTRLTKEEVDSLAKNTTLTFSMGI